MAIRQVDLDTIQSYANQLKTFSDFDEDYFNYLHNIGQKREKLTQDDTNLNWFLHKETSPNKNKKKSMLTRRISVVKEQKILDFSDYFQKKKASQGAKQIGYNSEYYQGFLECKVLNSIGNIEIETKISKQELLLLQKQLEKRKLTLNQPVLQEILKEKEQIIQIDEKINVKSQQDIDSEQYDYQLKIKNAPYITSLQGSILLTAGRSVQFIKSDFAGQTQRDSKRECFTSTIAIALAIQINKLIGKFTSFIIWKQQEFKINNRNNLDPNFLDDEMLKRSVFHQSIHKFIQNNVQDKKIIEENYENQFQMILPKYVAPMFHIEVRGKHFKHNQVDENKINIGHAPMDAFFSESDQQNISQPLIQQLKDQLDNYYLLNWKDAKTRPVVELNPVSNGLWKKEFHTLTSQCVQLGIPSIQVEISPSLRKQLAQNNDMQKEWARIIVNLYTNISRQWNNKTQSIMLNPSLASQIIDQNYNIENLDSLLDEYLCLDLKSQVDPNLAYAQF